MSTTDTGRQVEVAAADYLEHRGFKVVERNFRHPDCEIDIVARKGSCVYFVEVKYRASRVAGSGLEYVTRKKQAQMRYAAEVWLSVHSYDGEIALSAIEVSGPDYTVGNFIDVII